MYWLIDEIMVPPQDLPDFLKHLPYFRELYLEVKGVIYVTYAQTRLKAIGKITRKNPSHSFLLIIGFNNRKSFITYHDNSRAAHEIHAKISYFFGGKQLLIRTSLHGDEINYPQYYGRGIFFRFVRFALLRVFHPQLTVSLTSSWNKTDIKRL